MPKMRLTIVVAVTLLAAGCSLGGTAIATATQASAAAQQLKQGRQTEARVRQQLDAAMRKDQEQRDAAEAAAQ